MKDKRAVLIYSGGMDSYTLLRDLLHQGYDLSALSFDYGQKHGIKEVQLTEYVCYNLKVHHHVIDLHLLKELLGGSALTDNNIPMPTGHYTDQSQRLTIVPNRNMIMLSIAIGHAVADKRSEVYYGAHYGDFAVYPDCRSTFISAMNDVSEVANYNPVYIRAPYVHMTKGAILNRALNKLGLKPEDYALTWTCYQPQDHNQACGKCGACVERLEAFKECGVEDPIQYAQDQGAE